MHEKGHCVPLARTTPEFAWCCNAFHLPFQKAINAAAAPLARGTMRHAYLMGTRLSPQ